MRTQSCVALEGGGVNYVARVWRAGKALVVSIPKECAKELGIGEGDIVDVVVRVLKRLRVEEVKAKN